MKLNNKEHVFVIGDLHGRWDALTPMLQNVSQLPEVEEGDRITILQTGDMGYAPKLNWSPKDFVPMLPWGYPATVIFTPGNHDDHDSIDSLNFSNGFCEVSPSIYCADFGSVYADSHGRRFLFCGGAKSIDAQNRTKGVDWWTQEIISPEKMVKLPDVNIDIVISHTCPSSFDIELTTIFDPSQSYLQDVLRKYRPKFWFFSHFHMFKTGFGEGCQWWMLNNVERKENWWMPVPFLE